MEGTSTQTDYNDEDRFSRLHDSVIHYILSFNDTKCAVQTCVLSKRWIDVWKSLPFLNYNRSSFPNDKKHRFINFVDMVFLCHRQDYDIQRVNVCWENSGFDDLVTTNVNRWRVNAVHHNVQEISIVIDDYLHNLAYEIPYHLVHCQSLRKLEIRVSYIAGYVNIILPSSINLPRLKEMVLSGFSISNLELSGRLFSSCPVLETLDILGSDVTIDNGRNLIVDSPSLKRFAYSWSRRNLLPQNDINANIINLCAPNLEDFFCSFFFTVVFMECLWGNCWSILS
ncbi:F-box/LRR-repeat protein At1g55660-like [Papaver somniferum]|uniref:F-box/LRR-repeat protein At1g55660-like n=1 Tax=Papaver somniferum TaxID=3469 RepID=UPI000E700A44|nr:F-box/LRR-repeat protein At1g55660-like [Papaver somniferum]